MPKRKYLALALRYLDDDAKLYDVVPQEIAVIDFATWLDRAAEQRDAPVRAEQKCPTCKANCLPIVDGLEHFCPACGTSLGISNRSAGG